VSTRSMRSTLGPVADRAGPHRLTGMEGAARLLKLLTLLQSRPHWPGTELADRLEVTARTLRRDVTRLRDLGFVPGARCEVVARMWLGGDPIAVRIGGSTFALRRAEAAAVRVEIALGHAHDSVVRAGAGAVPA